MSTAHLWKSDWRLEQERRRELEAAAPKRPARPKPKAVAPPKPPRPRKMRVLTGQTRRDPSRPSRQAEWQQKRVAEGKCRTCGKPREGAYSSVCNFHGEQGAARWRRKAA